MPQSERDDVESRREFRLLQHIQDANSLENALGFLILLCRSANYGIDVIPVASIALAAQAVGEIVGRKVVEV